MKFIVLIIVYITFVQLAVSDKLTLPEIIRKLVAVSVPYVCECIRRTSVDPIVLDNYIHYGEYAKSEPLMCCIHYMYSESGMIGPDGEFVKYKLVDSILLPKDESEEVYNKCAKLKGYNKCNTVYLVDQCVFEEMKIRSA